MAVTSFNQVNIYELNTRLFCRKEGVTLGTFPESFFKSPEVQAADYVWLMGVWKPSPVSVSICKSHEGLLSELWKALPDLK
ncbi:MAG: hypothetical protein K8R21_09365 [Leptospira sp.]|nr:hypothetical protein [Leptospira sp.]